MRGFFVGWSSERPSPEGLLLSAVLSTGDRRLQRGTYSYGAVQVQEAHSAHNTPSVYLSTCHKASARVRSTAELQTDVGKPTDMLSSTHKLFCI